MSVDRENDAPRPSPEGESVPPFVSASVCQLKKSPPSWLGWRSSHCKILKEEMREFRTWPEEYPFSSRLPLKYRGGKAFYRRSMLEGFLSEQAVELKMHLLLMLYQGEVLVESPRGINIIPAGSFSFIPAGPYYFTEAPGRANTFQCIALFFWPRLLLKGLYPLERYSEIVGQLHPQKPNVYLLPRLLSVIPKEKAPELLNNLPRLMNVLRINGGVGLFMFLKEHFFQQREWLEKRLQRSALPPEDMEPLQSLHREYCGKEWKDGTKSAESSPEAEAQSLETNAQA